MRRISNCYDLTERLSLPDEVFTPAGGLFCKNTLQYHLGSSVSLRLAQRSFGKWSYLFSTV
jgi:hypothetical protein